MVNTADYVNEFLTTNTDIKKFLKMRIINQSALARVIMKEFSINNFDAVLAAVKRFSYNDQEKDLKIEILKKSNLEMAIGLSIIVIKRSYSNLKVITNIIINKKKLNSLKIIDTGEGFGILVEDVLVPEIKRYIPNDQILKINSNLGELTIISNEIIERTVGFVNYVTSLLSEMNILHIISFYTDTIIILEKYDLTRAFKIISSKMGK